MKHKHLHSTLRKQKGFTIVELLIVIVVIAILAAISVVAYNGIRNRAHDTAVMNDMANLRKKMEIRKIELEGRYPETQVELPDYKLSKSAYDTVNNNIYIVVNNTTGQYSIGLRSKSGKGFIGTRSQVYEGVTVNGDETATRIGETSWAASPIRYQCYAPAASPQWTADCKWTN